MEELSGFEKAKSGYKVRRTAWVVRGFPRGEWVSEVREDDWFGEDKQGAREWADYFNSTCLPERPSDAIVLEYQLFEKIIEQTVAQI